MILNLDQWLRRRCHLKYFLSGALVARIRWSGTICAILKEGNSVNNFAILVEGIKRNNSVK